MVYFLICISKISVFVVAENESAAVPSLSLFLWCCFHVRVIKQTQWCGGSQGMDLILCWVAADIKWCNVSIWSISLCWLILQRERETSVQESCFLNEPPGCCLESPVRPSESDSAARENVYVETKWHGFKIRFQQLWSLQAYQIILMFCITHFYTKFTSKGSGEILRGYFLLEITALRGLNTWKW